MDLGGRNAVAVVIRRNRPWKGLDDVEPAMLDWVCWYNERRLMEPIVYVPPAEFEPMYDQNQPSGLVPAGLH